MIYESTHKTKCCYRALKKFSLSLFSFGGPAFKRLSYQTSYLRDKHDGYSSFAGSSKRVNHLCIAILITSDKCRQCWGVWGYRETDRLGGPDPYSLQHEIAYRLIFVLFSKEEIFGLIGRAWNVIGGGDWAEDRIVPDCVRAWSQDQSLRNLNATRPWQHVLESLSGYLKLAIQLRETTELHGEPFNFDHPLSKIILSEV